MASLRDLSGRGWHEWPRVADADDASLSSGSSPSRGSGDATPASSRASTPPSTGAPYPDDDVMKLPRRDMRLFGRVPAQASAPPSPSRAAAAVIRPSFSGRPRRRRVRGLRPAGEDRVPGSARAAAPRAAPDLGRSRERRPGAVRPRGPDQDRGQAEAGVAEQLNVFEVRAQSPAAVCRDASRLFSLFLA